MKSCEDCDYKKHKDTTEWCYHFKTEPKRCNKWRSIPVARKSDDK